MASLLYIRGGVKDTRPRTQKNFEAKDRPSQGQGHSRKCSQKKRFSKKFFSNLKKKVFKNFFQAKKIFKNFFSDDFHLRKTKTDLRKFSARFLTLSNEISTVQKTVLSSSRGQGNFRGQGLQNVSSTTPPLLYIHHFAHRNSPISTKIPS